MTHAPGARRHRTAALLPRAGLLACLVLLAVLASAAPAAAHATLLGSDPAEGEVLERAPDAVTFTFDETVSLGAGAVQVFDAAGAPVVSEASSRDRTITAELPGALEDGTYVVVWRAVSADGHPIAGSLSFSVGAPSLTVAAPAVPAVRDEPARSLLSGAQAVGYAGLLAAGGLVLFLGWTSVGIRLDPRIRRRLVRVLRAASVVTVLAGVVALPLASAYRRGAGLGGAAASWDVGLLADDLLVLLLQVVGLGAAVLLLSRPRAAVAAAALAVMAPALIGHSRSVDPVWLLVTTDALHLAAGATWLGGLLALALTLPSLSGRPSDGAAILSRFSAIAAGLLVVLAGTGVLMGTRIVGGWAPLFETTYGRLLLAKVAIALVVMMVAGWSRWRLLPRVVAGVGHAERLRAVISVGRVVRIEAALLVVLLAVTGFLVNRTPREEAPDRSAVASRVEVGVLGQSRVLGLLTPGQRGTNTITVQVQSQDGEPLDGFAVPIVSLRSSPGSPDPIDLGEVPVRPTGSGTYSGEVVLPAPGAWLVQVSLRTSEFDNPVTTIRFEVR